MATKEYHFRILPGANDDEKVDLSEIVVKADRVETPNDEEGDRASYKLYHGDELVGAVTSIWVLAWWATESES